GGVRPVGSTFLIFSDYMRPPIRLAALCHLPAIFVFTHDSIGLGEDGPTHQPIEQLAGLRAIPNLTVIRPADATEVVEAWRPPLRNRGTAGWPITAWCWGSSASARPRRTSGSIGSWGSRSRTWFGRRRSCWSEPRAIGPGSAAQ